LLLFRGAVLERTHAGDVSYPTSIYHVCGLTGLYKALVDAARITSNSDPGVRHPFELLGYEKRNLTLRFDDVVVDLDHLLSPATYVRRRSEERPQENGAPPVATLVVCLSDE
jgi:hypothetical protein